MRRKLNRAAFTGIAVLLFMTASTLTALEVPRLQGRVNDYAGMISAGAEAQIESKLRALEASDSTQVVVLTIPALEGDSLEEFSIRVAEKWAIGQEQYDNGALLLVSKNDRKVRIEVGYGLEGVLTDLLSGRIIDHVIIPNFKAGRYDEGFLLGVDAIAQAVRGEYVGSGEAAPAAREGRSLTRINFMPLIILAIVLSLLGSRRRLLGGVAGALLLPLVLLFSLRLGFLALLLMVPLGFFGGFILPGFFYMSGAGRYHRGGFYGTGGGFSSGGGFSGGGGGFGGGGASGGW